MLKSYLFIYLIIELFSYSLAEWGLRQKYEDWDGWTDRQNDRVTEWHPELLMEPKNGFIKTALEFCGNSVYCVSIWIYRYLDVSSVLLCVTNNREWRIDILYSPPNIRFLILYQIDLYPVRNIPISLSSSRWGWEAQGWNIESSEYLIMGEIQFKFLSFWYLHRFYNEISCSMILAEIEIENC